MSPPEIEHFSLRKGFHSTAVRRQNVAIPGESSCNTAAIGSEKSTSDERLRDFMMGPREEEMLAEGGF